MPRFNQQTAVSALELQQLVAEWGYELDVNNCADITRLCTEDCTYMLGGKPFVGREAIAAFYAARNERVRTQQKDGIRTQRHTMTNLQISFDDPDHAKIIFVLVNYSAEGPPPIADLNAIGPSILADCRFDCRRDTDGEWRIALFDSTPVFVGNDPFLNASVAKK